MTLTEWEEKYGMTAKTHDSGQRWVYYDSRIWGVMAWELWHLTDWLVVAVAGGCVWLARKE